MFLSLQGTPGYRLGISALATSALVMGGLLACGVAPEPATQPQEAKQPEPPVELAIHDIQGRDHRSPHVGVRARTQGVVTALVERPSWLFVQTEQSDDDPATSEGLCVSTERVGGLAGFATGQRLRLIGRISEPAQRGELPVTCLELESFERLAEGVPLPEPVRVGQSGRAVPDTVVDDDGLSEFQPDQDGIDFFESLEGMRIEIPAPFVVGPTSKFGDITVIADRGAGASLRTSRKGLLEGPEDANPERFIVTGDAGFPPPDLNVGSAWAADQSLVGVVSYAFGGFRVMATEPIPIPASAAPSAELHRPARLEVDAEKLTVGSFNLLNLSVRDDPEKFHRLARVIVEQLASPDLLCVQEVQDDSGADDDGTVTAAATYERLIQTISALGGPTYRSHALDPIDNQEGGRPGGNIRVGFLFNPDRIEAGRLERLDDPAFQADPDQGWSHTRRPLLGQFHFQGEDFYAIGLHLRSKGRDNRQFGATQPPVRHSEPQRTRQAAAVRRWVDQLFEQDPAAKVIVLGDLNETSDRPPVLTLTRSAEPSRRLHDLALGLPAGDRYSFVFQGQSLLLDHVLVSESLATDAEIVIVRCCAETAASLQASDHDPIWVQLSWSESYGVEADLEDWEM